MIFVKLTFHHITAWHRCETTCSEVNYWSLLLYWWMSKKHQKHNQSLFVLFLSQIIFFRDKMKRRQPLSTSSRVEWGARFSPEKRLHDIAEDCRLTSEQTVVNRADACLNTSDSDALLRWEMTIQKLHFQMSQQAFWTAWPIRLYSLLLVCWGWTTQDYQKMLGLSSKHKLSMKFKKNVVVVSWQFLYQTLP